MDKIESGKTEISDDDVKAAGDTSSRDLSLAGVVIVLFIALTAGIICAGTFRLISDIASEGWHWKAAPGAIDTSFGDESDQPAPFTFKKVDAIELDDSLHLMQATESLFKMDYGKALAELNAISPERRKVDASCNTIEVECLLALKQPDKVIALANEHIDEKPGDYAGWVWRGEAYEQDKQYSQAIADYKRALTTTEKTREELRKTMPVEVVDKILMAINGMIFRRLGASYERSGDFKQAALSYESSVRTKTPNLSPTLEIKSDKSSIATAQKSIRELSSALSQRPDDDSLYMMRAKAFKIIGKNDQALLDYIHVHKTGTANFYYERAGANYALGDYKKAAYDLRKVHLEDPLYEMAHMRQKKYSTASLPMAGMKKSIVLNRLDKQIQADPKDDINYYHRGVLQMAFQEYDEAAQDLQQFIKLENGRRNVRVAKAGLYLAICRGLTKRMSEYDIELEKAADATDSNWWRSIISYMNDAGVTEATLLSAVENNKARAVQVHYYIGQRLAIKGLRVKALEHFKAGIKLGVPVDEYYLCKLALMPVSNSVDSE